MYLDITECPCNELVNHERGRDERRTKEKRHMVGPESTFCYIRWMGETAMRREHLVRMIRRLEAAWRKRSR